VYEQIEVALFRQKLSYKRLCVFSCSENVLEFLFIAISSSIYR